MPHSRRVTDVAVAGQVLTRGEHSLLAAARHLVKMKTHSICVVAFIDLVTSGVTTT
jgi:hypothetical protein